MPAKIGTGNVLFRVGSGSPSKVFLGTAAVQTVPGAPTISSTRSDDVMELSVADGGSPITDFVVYVDGDPVTVDDLEFEGDVNWAVDVDFTFSPGQIVQVSAVNAIGEGPQSDIFTVT